MEILRIYDKDMTELGVMADMTFLEYTKEFRGAGSAVVKLPRSSPAAKLFVPDGFIMTPCGTIYLIRTVEDDIVRGETVVRCAGLLDFFGGTAIGEEYTVSGDAAIILLALARRGVDNMPLNLWVEPVQCGKTVTFEGGRSYLLPDMVSVCHMGGIGMSLEYNDGGFEFCPLTVRDRTAASEDPVALSWDLGGFGAKRLTRDLSSYRNSAVVSGAEKESGGRYTVQVNSSECDMADSFPDSAHCPRQILVNYTAPITPYMKQTADGEKYFDEAQYLSDMRLAGAAALGRCRPKILLYGEADTDGTDIRPGDLLTVTDRVSGVMGTALTESIVTVYSDGGKKIYTGLSAYAMPGE